MKRVILFVLVLMLTVPAVAQKAVSGDSVPAKPFDPIRTEYEYEFTWVTGEASGYGITSWMAGGGDYWGDASAAIFENDLGVEVTLDTLRFMCANDDTDSSYWGIDTSPTDYGAGELGDIHVSNWPVNDLYTAAEGYSGSTPTTWTEVDVSGEGVTVADGGFFAVAYGLDEDEEADGCIGLTGDTFGYTYSVYGGAWDQDQPWGNTAVLNAVVSYGFESVETTSFGYIKGLYE